MNLSYLKVIVELVASPFHTNDSISYWQCKISEPRQAYLDLISENLLLPKHHFLEHYPEMIGLFRPLVLLWTVTFVAKHCYIKQVVWHTTFFKNITLTLVSKHQLMVDHQTYLQIFA